MPAAWDVGDRALEDMLNYFRNFLIGTNQVFHLYQNDYTPIPGSEVSDFDEATFTGYNPANLDGVDWGSVVVADFIASITQGVTAEYTYTSGAGSPQTIYGYYVQDADDNYYWAERFSTPRILSPGDSLELTPVFKVRTYPSP